MVNLLWGGWSLWSCFLFSKLLDRCSHLTVWSGGVGKITKRYLKLIPGCIFLAGAESQIISLNAPVEMFMALVFITLVGGVAPVGAAAHVGRVAGRALTLQVSILPGAT